MDSLPEECIVQVLAFVTSSPRSLHALLLTNRTLFRLSAAILYHNPFEYLERHVADILDRQAQQVKVLRLFLACIPDTLDAITTTSATTNTPLPGFRRPTIDYLSLYNCHFEKLLQFLITPALNHIPSATFASVPTLSAQQDRSVSSKQSTQQSHAQPRQLLPGPTGVRAHIHLGLVGHTPQHIHTIGYSIHGLSTLLPLVDQLSRLVRLELYKKSDRREISTATDFILAHRRIHQSLQEIKIKSADQSDLSPLIQAMGQPRVIDVSNWADADLYLHLFPLEQCRVLQMRQGLSRSASNLEGTIALQFDLTCLSHCTVIRNLRLNIGRKIPESWNPSLKAQQLAQCAISNPFLEIDVHVKDE
ncbi:hypothetical protein KI688_006835 [Linnemannia hyalina]|uniref:F-box domain-containing protein n=1 Tax=Linnemannia hyalina TaxID=64524 RepID=A0A9P8BMV7_9FUNG|nr:hypothetical protein KI688_006835 [Linnemannia hyalina]